MTRKTMAYLECNSCGMRDCDLEAIRRSEDTSANEFVEMTAEGVVTGNDHVPVEFHLCQLCWRLFRAIFTPEGELNPQLRKGLYASIAFSSKIPGACSCPSAERRGSGCPVHDPFAEAASRER